MEQVLLHANHRELLLTQGPAELHDLLGVGVSVECGHRRRLMHGRRVERVVTVSESDRLLLLLQLLPPCITDPQLIEVHIVDVVDVVATTTRCYMYVLLIVVLMVDRRSSSSSSCVTGKARLQAVHLSSQQLVPVHLPYRTLPIPIPLPTGPLQQLLDLPLQVPHCIVQCISLFRHIAQLTIVTIHPSSELIPLYPHLPDELLLRIHILQQTTTSSLHLRKIRFRFKAFGSLQLRILIDRVELHLKSGQPRRAHLLGYLRSGLLLLQ